MRAKKVKILAMEIAPDQKSAIFNVQGSNGVVYRVKIYKINTNFMFSNCTCPYDWGGLCKHEVATLDLLDKEIQNVVVKSMPKAKDLPQFNSIDPYIINNTKVVTMEMVYEHSGSNYYQYYPN